MDNRYQPGRPGIGQPRCSSSVVRVCIFFVFSLFLLGYLSPSAANSGLRKGGSDASPAFLSLKVAPAEPYVLQEFEVWQSNKRGLGGEDEYTVAEVSLLENEEEEEMKVEHSIEVWISFFLCSFLCAAALQWLVSHISLYTVPISIIWFVFGMLLSLTVANLPDTTENKSFPLVQGILATGKMNAEIVYLVFLPILLYEASLNCDWHKFKRFLISGLTLAVLGVFYQVAIVGVLVQISFPTNPSEGPTNTWWNSFLIASAMASTDPVAVISILNNLNAPPKLASMFDGEALINDGSSMLLFQLFKALSRGDTENWKDLIKKLLPLLFLGPIWGVGVGILMYLWLKRFRRYPDMQVLALMASSYAVYFVGEKFLTTSGPISIVCFGLYYTAFSHIGLDSEAQAQLHHSVRALGSLANSSIFIIAGVVAMRMMYEAVTSDNGLTQVQVWNVPVLYIYLLIARIIMVMTFLPVLRRTGYGVNWKEVVLLVWGGLRGAIVLAMGLMIEQDHQILSFMRYQAVLYIAGCTFLILLLNGVTFELLYKVLNPYPPKPFRRVYLERVMKMIDYQYLEERRVLEDHWLFRGTGILYYADKAVPVLGWRRMNHRGKIDFKLPSLTTAFHGLPNCDSWIPPSLAPPKFFTTSTGQDVDSPDDFQTTVEMANFSSPGSPAPLSEVMSSPVGSPLERLASVEREGGDAEQRAHAATVALLGLRDTRPGLNTFDAKYYLRLVGHLGDDAENSPSPGRSRRPSVASAAAASPAAAAVDDNEDPPLSRADTDRTIIFPAERISPFTLSRSSSMQREQQPGHPILVTSPSRGRRSGSDDEMFRRGSSLGGSANRQNQRPRFMSSAEHYAAPYSDRDEGSPVPSPAVSHNTSLQMIVPTFTSEPFGSHRLDGVEVGRMTRLRQFEWDSRRGSTTGHTPGRFHSGLPRQMPPDIDGCDPFLPYAHRHSDSNQFRTSSGFNRPGMGGVGFLGYDDSPHRGEPSHAAKSAASRRRTRFRKERPRRGSVSGGPLDVPQGLSPKTKSGITLPLFKRKGERHPSSQKENTTHMPSRVVSAPMGRLDIGNLGFYVPGEVDGSSSIGSSEEYLEMPETPRRGLEAPKSGARIKVLRKEREGELYIMVFNAIRQMYGRLYTQHFIGGSAMLSLTAVLDHSTDFAIGKLKKNPIKAWREVLEGVSDETCNKDDLLEGEVVAVTEGMTGFEFEWRALVCRLRCVRRGGTFFKWLNNRFPEQSWVRAAVTYSPAMSDLEQVTAFVDVHEELLFKGGHSLEELLGPKLLFSFRKQVYEAKRFVLKLRVSYPESYPHALGVHAATLLVNLKQQLIDEQAQKGLILEEDSNSLNHLFEEQHQNLASYRPVNLSCFSWLKGKCSCGCCGNGVVADPSEIHLEGSPSKSVGDVAGAASSDNTNKPTGSTSSRSDNEPRQDFAKSKSSKSTQLA